LSGAKKKEGKWSGEGFWKRTSLGSSKGKKWFQSRRTGLPGGGLLIQREMDICQDGDSGDAGQGQEKTQLGNNTVAGVFKNLFELQI